MKWYISGKISGLPTDQVTAKFKQAEQQIRAFGHEPVNPTNNGLGSEASWNEHLVADVALLLECDAIYLLKDWGDSRGSRIEANIAECHYFTAGEGVAGATGIYPNGGCPVQPLALLTFCVLVLNNVFTVTGESACASPENFDAELGRKIARQNAVQKIYELRSKLSQ